MKIDSGTVGQRYNLSALGFLLKNETNQNQSIPKIFQKKVFVTLGELPLLDELMGRLMSNENCLIKYNTITLKKQ